MFQLYTVLQAPDSLPTPDETAFASGKKLADDTIQAKWLNTLEAASNNLEKAFAAQQAKVAVSQTLILCIP